MAIYIVALASFTTFFCEGCGADSWVVGYDQNDKPFNAVCFICAAEYLVEEDGTFAERIDK